MTLSKTELLELGTYTNKYNGTILEILPKDPYGWNAPNPPTENHVFIKDINSKSYSVSRGCYANIDAINKNMK